MKHILITGANSYVGDSFAAYLSRWPEDYQVDTLDMIDGSWRESSFRGYDAVLHVAGIVHQKATKDDPSQAALYEKVNTRLPMDVAQKAKAEGVGQFLFMSSESVYGLTAPMGKPVFITADTPLNPCDNYGISKLKAEQGLAPMNDDSFKVVILRPPMIYGKGCKGNYCTLAKLAKKLPLFPYVPNQRSMLYMENLAQFLRLMIDNGESGLFCPQNDELINTSEMVRLIAAAGGKKMPLIHGVSWAIRLLRPLTSMVDKAFGSLCYDRSLSDYREPYCVKNLEQSILETES